MKSEDLKIATTQRKEWGYILQDNIAAMNLVDSLGFVAQIWDDLVDGGDPDIEDINKAFWIALIEIPQNPFYIRYQVEFIPLFREYINSWMDANTLEKGNSHQQTIAFVLRDNYCGIVSQCAYLIGGYVWMRKVSPEIRKLIFDETLEQYTERLKVEEG
jgi:hypothetical protein